MEVRESCRIALDVLGGDGGLAVNLAGAQLALESDPCLSILAFGPETAVSEGIAAWPAGLRERVEIAPVDHALAPDAGPAEALRKGKNSSISRVLQSLSERKSCAAVSGGSTGALMVLSRHLLGTWPGVDRPALMGALPTKTGVCWTLDLGANLHVDAPRLHEFARLGEVAVRLLNGKSPLIGLLNVGTEPGKGPDLVREAARLLESDNELNFQGFVEADQVFEGRVDLVVCDGFSGNVLLKSAEGAVRMMFSQLGHILGNSLCGWLARPRLRGLRDSLDPARHNGAALLGVRGVVIKSHGGACERGVAYAIALAAREARAGLIDAMEEQFNAVD